MHPGFVSQFFHGRDVAIGEVHHMDVIAHAGTIFGRIVVTKMASDSRRPTATWAM